MKIVKAIRVLIREARMNRVYAGKGIAVMRGPRGTLVARLEAEGGGGGGGEYKGKFKVGMIGSKLYIYDGSDEDNVNAGTIIAGASHVAFPKTELELIDGDIYAILEYIPSDQYGYAGEWITHNHQGAIVDSPWKDNSRAAHFLIATYGATMIVQQHTTGNIIVTGRWL